MLHATNVEPSTLLQGHFSTVTLLSRSPDGSLPLLMLMLSLPLTFFCPCRATSALLRPSASLSMAGCCCRWPCCSRCQPCLRCSQCPPHLLHPFPAGPLQRCHVPQPLSRWLLLLTLLILAQILHLRPFAGSLQCCHVPQPLSRWLAAAVGWARQGRQCVGHSNQFETGNGARL